MGHVGQDRVLDLARKRFYWPGMSTDINQFVTKKCRWLRSKKPNVLERAPLCNITSTEPFELVTLDYLHLDKCKEGFEYVLVIVDHFTKFVQAFATKNKNAKSAADKLYHEYVLNFGFPKQILHDKYILQIIFYIQIYFH